MPVRTLDVDSAGERIACSTVDGRILVHRLVDGTPLFTLSDHTGSVPVVRFAVGGSRLLTAGVHTADQSRTGRAIVWNTNDQSRVRVCRGRSRSWPLISRETACCSRPWKTASRSCGSGRFPTARSVARSVAPRTACYGCVSRPMAARCSRPATMARRASRLSMGIASPSSTPGSTFVCADVLPRWHDGADDEFSGQTRGPALAQRTGPEVSRFNGHRGTVEWGAFNPDGTWAVTTSRDGTARIWPTDPVAVAKRLPLRLLTAAEKVSHGLVRPTEQK